VASRPIYCAREITKIHEETFRGTLIEARDWYKKHAPRGEFTIVLGPSTISTSDTRRTPTPTIADETEGSSGEGTEEESSVAVESSSDDIDDALKNISRGERIERSGVRDDDTGDTNDNTNESNAASNKPNMVQSYADAERKIVNNSTFGEARLYKDRLASQRREAITQSIDDAIHRILKQQPDIGVRNITDIVMNELGVSRGAVYGPALRMVKARDIAAAEAATAAKESEIADETDTSIDATQQPQENKLESVQRLATQLQRTADTNINTRDSELEGKEASGDETEELSPELHALMQSVLGAASSMDLSRVTSHIQSSTAASTSTKRRPTTPTPTTSTSGDAMVDDAIASLERSERARRDQLYHEASIQAFEDAKGIHLGIPSSIGITSPSSSNVGGGGAGPVNRRSKRGSQRHIVTKRKTPRTMKSRI
jgi:hypothetical protein